MIIHISPYCGSYAFLLSDESFVFPQGSRFSINLRVTLLSSKIFDDHFFIYFEMSFRSSNFPTSLIPSIVQVRKRTYPRGHYARKVVIQSNFDVAFYSSKALLLWVILWATRSGIFPIIGDKLCRYSIFVHQKQRVNLVSWQRNPPSIFSKKSNSEQCTRNDALKQLLVCFKTFSLGITKKQFPSTRFTVCEMRF